MPNDPIAEQVEVRRKGRQRLVGAIVLALVAVVFVPMVLDPEPRRDRPEPVLSIPPKDGSPPLAQLPKAPESPAQPAKAASPAVGADAAPAAAAPSPAIAAQPAAVAPQPASTVSAPATVAPKAAEFRPAPPRTKPAEAPARPVASPDPKLVGFAVQVGAFREDDKLAQARQKVAAAKLPHYTERVDDGGLTRLRAGPFTSREAAEKAAAQLKRAGFDPRVVPLP
jgi:DedD protein